MVVNDYAADARERKAIRLASVFYDRARDACFKYDEAQAVKPRSADQCSEDIARMVDAAGPSHWFEIARVVGVRPPSTATMEMAAQIVRRRADRARQRARQEVR